MKLFKRDNSPYWWYEFSYMGKRTRASTLRPHSDKVGAHRVMHQEYRSASRRPRCPTSARC